MSETNSRDSHIQSLKTKEFDLVVIGGGATGVAVAFEAVARGLSVAICEQGDFSSGTSSRSTKLLHGGVRYLEKAFKELDVSQFNLVKDALRERKFLLDLAPHLTYVQPIVIPLYKYWEIPYFFSGLTMYDLLSGSKSIGRSKVLSRSKILELLPAIDPKGVKGGVLYYDGLFNDSRLNVEVVTTCAQHGASVANYLKVESLIKNESGRLEGVTVTDEITGESFSVSGKFIVNATGPYVDHFRLQDNPEAKKMIRASSGAHIIIDKKLFPGGQGLLIPSTDDGRVVFILPWFDVILIGTTDEDAELEVDPQATSKDIDYLISYANRYLKRKITIDDVLSSWSGLRPLVTDPKASDTAGLSRDHVIDESGSGLITIAGGKWTTFRKMGEDVVLYVLDKMNKKLTRSDLKLVEPKFDTKNLNNNKYLSLLEEDIADSLISRYGSNSVLIAEIASNENVGQRLFPNSSIIKAEVLYCIRKEFVITADDFLARRTRVKFKNNERYTELLEKVNEIIDLSLS